MQGLDLSVVLPVYGEDACLEECLARIHNVLRDSDLRFECILVDDGSPDHTWELIRELIALYPAVRGIRLSRNFGKEAALAAGLQDARGRLILTMDADLQHPPELIPRFLELQRQTGANVVEGLKSATEGQRPLRKLSNRLFYGTLHWLSGLDLANHSDFKLIDQTIRRAWLQMGERALFYRGLIAWLGFHKVQIRFVVPHVEGRVSRWSVPNLFQLALGGLTAFSSAPLHLTTLTGFGFFLAAVLLGLQTLYNWVSGRAATGFSTVILLQLIIGSLTLLSLGLIGLYISRIYDEVKGRPRYFVRETVGAEPLL